MEGEEVGGRAYSYMPCACKMKEKNLTGWVDRWMNGWGDGHRLFFNYGEIRAYSEREGRE